jgi:hypothetical protein
MCEEKCSVTQLITICRGSFRAGLPQLEPNATTAKSSQACPKVPQLARHCCGQVPLFPSPLRLTPTVVDSRSGKVGRPDMIIRAKNNTSLVMCAVR